MEQFYSHHDNWEDFKNGMYCGTSDNNQEQIEKAKSLLSDSDLFYKTMHELLIKWPISSKVNLTNKGINRRSWLGHAACNFMYSIPEIVTRKAWNELSEIQQFNANTIAERFINEYENSHA